MVALRQLPDAASRADGLELYLFSSFRAYQQGQPLANGLGGKARQLLKVLAANRRRWITKDALIETLWPDAEPSSGAVSLKVVAHRLRTALDPMKQSNALGAWITAENGTYRLNPDAPIWIDAEAFREHYERGCVLQSQGDPAAAELEFDRAEVLYTGDYLEEDLYEDWTVLRREELRDIYLDTLNRLALLALSGEKHADVIRYCHKIVLADPCREDAYRMLMRSHAALNQYARAGAWYAVCRVTLAREIGGEPSKETTESFEGLFRREHRLPSLAAPTLQASTRTRPLTAP